MSVTYDAVVVGAGPAGSAAALVLARAGKRVALLERGPWPGSKNMYGGVIHGRALDALVPQWWEEVPVQRWLARRTTMVLDGDRSVAVDARSGAWGRASQRGCITLRPDFDAWFAGKAGDAGADVLTSTVATAPVCDETGAVVGVDIDRPGGPIHAGVVVACDGVNSLLARAAGLHRHAGAGHVALGVKEVLTLPRDEIDRRFGLSGREGAEIRILGATGTVPGGGFVYTNADSVAVGVVLSLPALAAAGRRPESYLTDLKAHPAVAPLVAGGDLKEYSAHLLPDGGPAAGPVTPGPLADGSVTPGSVAPGPVTDGLVTDGLVVAGDAAGVCLAAGMRSEGVTFAIGSGVAAGRAAAAALDARDTSAAGLAGYRRRLETSFALGGRRAARRAPSLPSPPGATGRRAAAVCDLAEALLAGGGPAATPDVLRAGIDALRGQGIGLPGLVRDAWTAARVSR